MTAKRRQILDPEIASLKIQLSADKEARLLANRERLNATNERLLDSYMRLSERQLEKERQRIEKGQFVNGEGFPDIYCNFGPPSPFNTSMHSEMPTINKLTIDDVDFGTFDVRTAVRRKSLACSRLTGTLDNNWNSKSDIEFKLRNMFHEAFNATGESNVKFHSFSKIDFIALRRGIWSLTIGGYHLGVVQVELPSSDTSRRHSQDPQDSAKRKRKRKDTASYNLIAHYMMMLRNYFGQPVVFGIISSYEKWRICWLGDDSADKLAQATAPIAAAMGASPTAVPTASAATDKKYPCKVTAPAAAAHLSGDFFLRDYDVPTLAGDLEQQPHLESPSPPVNRTITDVRIGASREYSHSDPQLPLVLVTLMHKLTSLVSPAAPNLINPEERRCVCFSNEAIEWRTQGPWRPDFKRELHIGEMRSPAPNAMFYSLGSIGGGGDGQAWLIRDCAGFLFVCKMANEPHAAWSKLMSKEFHRWEKVHPELVGAQLVQLRHFGPKKVPALIMPRFALVRKNQHKDPAILTAVNEEMENFARAELVHDDLNWRHVGLYYDNNSKLRAVFFDLARILKAESKDQAIQSMSKELLQDCRKGWCDDCREVEAEKKENQATQKP